MTSAVIDDSNPSCQPLLPVEEDTDIYSIDGTRELAQHVRSSLKRSHLLAGGFFGVLLQLCTLGVNSILEASWMLHSWPPSIFDVLAASLMWSCVSSLISLAALRSLRCHTFKCYGEDKIDGKLLMQLDCRFVMGAVYGICFAWSLIDLANGSYFFLIANFFTTLVAWTCCYGLEWWNGESPSSSELANIESICNDNNVV